MQRSTAPWASRRYRVQSPLSLRCSALARLTVAPELEGLVLAVGRVLATTVGVVEAVALANTAALLAGGSEATRLTVLVNGVGDPVDARVAADRLVLRVDTDDLKVLVHTVLVHPVRVEDTQVRSLAANALLSEGAERALGLEVVHTLAHRLTVGGTLRNRLLAVTAADTHTVDHVALLGLVAKAASLVRARRARGAVDHVQLTVLPAASSVSPPLKTSSTYRTRSRKRSTSLCFFLYSSSRYL